MNHATRAARWLVVLILTSMAWPHAASAQTVPTATPPTGTPRPANRPEVRRVPRVTPPAAQPGTAAPQVRRTAAPRPIQAPFQLTEQEARYVDQVLLAWQNETDKIKTFKCNFTRWNYNPAFEDPRQKGEAIYSCEGDLKYATPDKGTFRVRQVMHLDAETGKYEDAKEKQREHWVCDGKAMWEYDYTSRRVIERPIPKEMQGKALRHSPLPFLFGSRAEDLKRRYFLRIVTPKDYAKTEIWIDAFPRGQVDAANFQRAILRLDRKTFQPLGLRIYDPGDTYASYEFTDIQINDPLESIKQFFAAPLVPFGWRKVLELPPEATARNSAAR